MPEEFYYRKLYILQDEVMQVIGKINSDFYLTGGTALSRVYLNHRYSDDLDFFCNQSPEFQKSIENIKRNLSIQFDTEIIIASDSLVRLNVNKNSTLLKLDFVNDVAYRHEQLSSWEKYPRVDHPLNILSNKISALSRLESKDAADILFLAYSFSFNWEFIIGEAQKKDMWVNPIDVSGIIETFPVERFDEIKWIAKPNYRKAEKDLKTIAKNIVLGADNKLNILHEL